MPRNSRKRILALLLILGMAGCGGPHDPAVASAGSPKAGAGTAGNGDGSQLKFAQCVRAQGFSWFPDPGPDGGLKVSVPDGTDQDKFHRAQEACKPYAPGSNRTGPVSAADLDKLRKVSQCIRDRGFPKYPDPDANGTIGIDNKVLGVGPDDPVFRKAITDCGKYLPTRKHP